MRLKTYTLKFKIQEWFIFVCALILLSCKPQSGKTNVSVSDNTSVNRYHNTIDSLVSRISNDTVALFNYLSLAQSTGDLYAEMKTYRQLGLYYLNNHAFQQAIEYHTQYLETAEKNGGPIGEIEALNTLAYDYKKICALDESSAYYFKALSLLNKPGESNDRKEQSEKAKTLNGLGNIYLRINQPDEAIVYLRQSLQIEMQNNNIPGQAKNLADIGSYFESKAAYDSAHHYFDRSLQLYLSINWVSGINYCYERIGNLYMMEGDYHGASVYIESAYNSLQHTSDRLNWLNSCFSLANIWIQRGKHHDAEALLHEGLQVAEAFKLPGYLEKGSMLLSKLYKQQGNTVAALEAYAMSVSYAKAFRSEQNISRIMTHRLAYEKTTNEKKTSLLTAQLDSIERKKTKAIYVILLILIALAGFIVILVQQYLLRKQKVESSLYMERAKSDFYVNISHEFETPVTIITGLIERLRNNLGTDDPCKSSTDLDILSRQSQNLLSLIDRMSSATSIQKTGRSHSTVHGNIVTWLSCLFESFSVLAESKEINYSFHKDIRELDMDYQPETLRLIFSSLLGNIIQYCRKGDNISIGIDCDSEGKACIISVSDSGEAIRKEELLHILKSYRNINYNSMKNKAGIGILFVRQLVEKLNGSIEVESKSPQEILFRISLPITHEQRNDDRRSLIIHNPLTSGMNPENDIGIPSLTERENPTVLVVENNRDMVYYLSSILKEYYQPFIVETGRRAAQKAAEIMPDIIIANIAMPGMNGYDLCKEIKSSDITAHIPVILLSPYCSKEERIKGFRCGADAFLSRPVHEEELLAVIDQLIDTRRQISSKYALITVNTGRSKEQGIVKSDVSLEFIKQITDLIYKEIDNTDNIIDIISDKVCLSSSQLNRKIKAATGMTTSNYILKVRLGKAGQILSRSTKPIGEIAMNCGFNDFAYFSRAFKKEFGMTPTSFQRLPHSVN